jgi:hypothetical protein
MGLLIIILIAIGIAVLFGLGRAIFKGRPQSFRDFIFTMLFIDIMFDDWSRDDAGISDTDVDL